MKKCEDDFIASACKNFKCCFDCDKEDKFCICDNLKDGKCTKKFMENDDEDI
jgi:hypothetical protein